MWNRQEMLSRIQECHRQGVPITNYGLVIAYALGILERALEPFPEALAAYKDARREQLEPATTPIQSQLTESNMSLVN
jgi:hypothetical protein